MTYMHEVKKILCENQCYKSESIVFVISGNW